jgi:antitoxin YefM
VDTASVNRFRNKLKYFVEKVVNTHTLLKVTRRSGDDVVIISTDDWEREKKNLFLLTIKVKVIFLIENS